MSKVAVDMGYNAAGDMVLMNIEQLADATALEQAGVKYRITVLLNNATPDVPLTDDDRATAAAEAGMAELDLLTLLLARAAPDAGMAEGDLLTALLAAGRKAADSSDSDGT